MRRVEREGGHRIAEEVAALADLRRRGVDLEAV
jgi:hypothetical protein